MKSVCFCSYTDDTVIYINNERVKYLTSKLKTGRKPLFKCFSNNMMKANPSKCYLYLKINDKQEIRDGDEKNYE